MAGPGFIVRRSEMELLDRFLLGEGRVLNLFGPGGIGKSVVTYMWEDAREQGVIVASRDVAGSRTARRPLPGGLSRRDPHARSGRAA